VAGSGRAPGTRRWRLSPTPGGLPATDERLVVLSPHFDDGVFSIGAAMHRHVRSGGRAVVVTVFGGPPGMPDDAGSPLARGLHARWLAAAGVDADPPGDEADATAAASIVARRRREDAAALAILGAEQVVLPFADCIYRRVSGGGWRCPTEESLFAPDGPAEPDLERDLASALADIAPGSRVLAPLALGGHVDHVLVQRAARRLDGVAYYEDVPYNLIPGSWSGRRARGLAVQPWPIESEDLAAKAAACLEYASQWSTFWPDRAALESALGRAAGSGWQRGLLAEPLWTPKEGQGQPQRNTSPL
jgi:LmbE family N-acetylglucosaminyl deacetylase